MSPVARTPDRHSLVYFVLSFNSTTCEASRPLVPSLTGRSLNRFKRLLEPNEGLGLPTNPRGAEPSPDRIDDCDPVHMVPLLLEL